jgi:hypothetical protein
LSNRDEVEVYIKAARGQYKDGKLPENSYYKVMASLSAELLENYGDQERSMEVFHLCPPEYFQDTIELQMNEDALFAQCMAEFIYHLNRYGIIGLEPSPPTQAPATA